MVDWLNDEYKVYECGDKRIAVIGTRGALARPTRWQRRHMPWLEKVYRERPRRIIELAGEARRESDYIIILSHYALSKATIEGEPPRIWPELYSPLMEKAILKIRPEAAIHGHAHNGKPFAFMEGIPVYNVALPLNKRIVEVRLATRRSLLDYT